MSDLRLKHSIKLPPKHPRNPQYLVVGQLLTQEGSTFKIPAKFHDIPSSRTYSTLK